MSQAISRKLKDDTFDHLLDLFLVWIAKRYRWWEGTKQTGLKYRRRPYKKGFILSCEHPSLRLRLSPTSTAMRFSRIRSLLMTWTSVIQYSDERRKIWGDKGVYFQEEKNEPFGDDEKISGLALTLTLTRLWILKSFFVEIWTVEYILMRSHSSMSFSK